jgi:hypothetical protein
LVLAALPAIVSILWMSAPVSTSMISSMPRSVALL